MHASYEWNPELGFKEQQGYKWIEIELDQNYQGIHKSQKHKKFYGVKQGESVQDMVSLGTQLIPNHYAIMKWN